MKATPMKSNTLALAVCTILCLPAQAAFAQAQSGEDDTAAAAQQRASVTTSSNTSNSNATQRLQQLDAVSVTGQSASLGGGNMQYQAAPKAVSTISREAILRSVPSANFTQVMDSIPGVSAASNDATGLQDGYFSVRGYPMNEVGVTVDGVPVNDSGDYWIYASEYGDAENIGDITVQPGYADVSAPVLSAVGGTVTWVSMSPTHDKKLDFSTGFGSNNFRRQFIRYNTGDLGPVRSWFSYSHNEAELWRGGGEAVVEKIDGKAVWDIAEGQSITASLQYNREVRSNYKGLTKAQSHADYFQGYAKQWDPAERNGDYYRLHNNPFRSWALSLDGEFSVGDFTHISVVPYFWYGYGGGSSDWAITEVGAPSNIFWTINQDISGDGQLDGTWPAYSMWRSNTHRPGIHAKVKHDLSMDYSIEYGFWHEEPRHSLSQSMFPIGAGGEPVDLWGQNDAYALTYSNGDARHFLQRYTASDITRFFVANTWTPNDAWLVNFGANYTLVKRDIRYAQFPGSDAEVGVEGTARFENFNPSAGVKYQINDAHQVYLGVSKTFRAPIVEAAQNWLMARQAGASVEKPSGEEATSADLGWRYYGDALSASASVYMSDFKNKEVSGTDEATRRPVYVNFPKVTLRGLSAEAGYTFNEQWNVYGSYSHIESKIKGDVDLGSAVYATDGKTMLNAPEDTLYASVNYSNGGFWTSLNAKYTSELWGDWSNTEKAGGYTLLNLGAGWNFQDWSFARKPYVKVNISNLTDKKALTYATNTGSYLAAQSTPSYVLQQDRSLMVTFGLSFY